MGRMQPRPVLPALALIVMLIAGIWILQHGMRGETPPQPSAAQAYSPPSAGPSEAAVGPVVDRPPPYRAPFPRPTTGPGARTGSGTVPQASSRPTPQAGSSSGARRDTGTARHAGPTPTARRVSEPVRLRIRAIGVNAPMVKLALNPSGVLEPPPAGKADHAGWYAKGPIPGEGGTAVLAGHVDTPTGRHGAFFALGKLPKGSTVEVTRKDGRTSVFTVDAVEVYPRNKFPDPKVYGSSAKPQLRLITCGGRYTKAGGYAGNVVAYASLLRTVPASPPGRTTPKR